MELLQIEKMKPLRTAASRFVRKTIRRVCAKRITPYEVENGLEQLGVSPGGLVLVHSSFSSLGYVPGGPGAFIDQLRSVIGPSGTIVFPTHSWKQMNAGSRRFDVLHTPSCVGLLAETFRRMGGVSRSMHPTHSVAAVGPDQRWLVEGHLTAGTPCGSGSPYEKLCQSGGQVLFLGATLKSNTIFHTAEALANVDYLMQKEPARFEIVREDGSVNVATVDMHAQGIGRCFDSLADGLEADGILRYGSVGQAKALLLDAGALLDWTVSRLKQDSHLLLSLKGGDYIQHA